MLSSCFGGFVFDEGGYYEGGYFTRVGWLLRRWQCWGVSALACGAYTMSAARGAPCVCVCVVCVCVCLRVCVCVCVGAYAVGASSAPPGAFSNTYQYKGAPNRRAPLRHSVASAPIFRVIVAHSTISVIARGSTPLPPLGPAPISPSRERGSARASTSSHGRLAVSCRGR